MTKQIEVLFNNNDAVDRFIRITVGSMAEANHVMAWYGAFYSGDDYQVAIDGDLEDIDIDGNLSVLNELPPGDEPRG